MNKISVAFLIRENVHHIILNIMLMKMDESATFFFLAADVG